MLGIIRALHIIAVISWFAGLFYLGRLLIYAAEAAIKPEKERAVLLSQFKIMKTRVWRIICNPAAILSVGFGLHLAGTMGSFAEPWMHAKFSLVLGLVIYHIASGYFHRQQEKGSLYSPKKLRIFNEVLTVFMVAIVFLVATKDVFLSLKAVCIFSLIIGGTFSLLKWIRK